MTMVPKMSGLYAIVGATVKRPRVLGSPRPQPSVSPRGRKHRQVALAGGRKRAGPHAGDKVKTRARTLHIKSVQSVVTTMMVGSAAESREEHTQRCGEPGCPRCRWYARGHAWQATYGSLESTAGPREKIVWLRERPATWKGAWGLGCYLCADALARRSVLGGTAGTPAGKRTPGRKAPEWRTSCHFGLRMRPGLPASRQSM